MKPTHILITGGAGLSARTWCGAPCQVIQRLWSRIWMRLRMPAVFVETNVKGTLTLPEACREELDEPVVGRVMSLRHTVRSGHSDSTNVLRLAASTLTGLLPSRSGLTPAKTRSRSAGLRTPNAPRLVSRPTSAMRSYHMS